MSEEGAIRPVGGAVGGGEKLRCANWKVGVGTWSCLNGWITKGSKPHSASHNTATTPVTREFVVVVTRAAETILAR